MDDTTRLGHTQGPPVDALQLKRAAIALVAAIAVGALIGVVGPVYAAGAAVAVAVLIWAMIQPERAIILVPLAIFIPTRGALADNVAVSTGDLLLAVIAVGWVLWAWRRKSLLLDRDPLLALLIIVVAAPALALFNSPSKALSLIAFIRSFQVWFLFFAIVLSTVRDEDTLEWLLKAFVAVVALQAFVGIYQFLTASGAFVGGSFTRAYGTGNLHSWMDFAVTMGLAICLVSADLLVRRGAGVWRWGVLALLVIGTLATYTRGVWLAILVAVTAMVLASRPKALVILVIVVGVLLAFVAANPASDLAERVVSVADPNDPSVMQRTYLWRTAVEIFKDHPLVGAGAKSFGELRNRYAVPGLEVYSYHETPGESLKVELLSPHNFYLWVSAELGLVGLLSFLALFTVLLVRGLGTYLHARSERLSSMALGLSGALLFLLVHATHSDLFHSAMLLTIGFLLACLAAAGQMHRRQQDTAGQGADTRAS